MRLSITATAIVMLAVVVVVIPKVCFVVAVVKGAIRVDGLMVAVTEVYQVVCLKVAVTKTLIWAGDGQALLQYWADN